MNALLVCLGLFLIGVALHVSRGFWFAQEVESARESSLGDALRLLAYLCQAVGVLQLLAIAMGPFAIVAALIALFALGDAALRNALQERRTLAWIFAAAARHQTPLTEALSAFFSSTDVRPSTKGTRLVSLLSLGMPLHLALQGAGVRLTPALHLATAQGAALGALPERVTRAISDEEQLEQDIRRLNQKIGYTAALLLTMSILLFAAAGLMVRAIPMIESMLSEFNVSPPPLVHLVVATREEIFTVPAAGLAFLAALAVAPLLALLVALHQYGFYLWNYPLATRLLPAFDRALLYQSLAVSFRRGEPLRGVFDQLGIFFPRGYIRHRIRQASRRCAQGAPWLEALAREGLIPSRDRSLLESAEKHGDLAWSLEELARLRSQRQIQRLETAATIVNALLILFLGAFAFFYGYAVYMTIVLITGNSI